jgi:NAD(P)H-hydrate epimerase
MNAVNGMRFSIDGGQIVPGVTAEQMREVDRIAVEEFGLGVLQMMENAGRGLALNVIEMLASAAGEVSILAGSGGNGGGGICAGRHLHNRGFEVHILLDRDPGQLRGSAEAQYHIIDRAGLRASNPAEAEQLMARSDLVIDALIGYSLKGAPRGRVEELISICNRSARRVLALDLPSGVDATTGDRPGVAVRAERTLTLALPKTGLSRTQGELFLADIGIPLLVYRELGIEVEPFFGDRYHLPLRTAE